ncbi:MAG: phosphoenolpyruvate--protein phosphotransferase [Treponemataceae bacterium]
MKKLSGLVASDGLAVGKAYVLPDEKELVVLAYAVSEKALPTQEKKLDDAIETVKKTLSKSINETQGQAVSKEILETQLAMLSDTAFIDEVKSELRQGKMNIEYTLNKKVASLVDFFNAQDDPYMQARAIDIKDAFDSVLYELLNKAEQNKNRFTKVPAGAILFASEIKPSEAILLRDIGIAGLVNDKGSATSHVAIMARAWGIPMLVGVNFSSKTCNLNEKTVVLDADNACVICEPSETEIQYFSNIIKEKKFLEEKLFEIEVQDAPFYKTKDNIPIKLDANITLPEEVKDKKFIFASGVGLFRTEFLVLDEARFPDEEEQFKMYAELVKLLNNKPIVMRTFDIGADKMISEQELLREKNPMLGWRGLRYFLDKQSLFKSQIRAILRAGSFGNVKILLPMVSTVDEVFQAKKIIAEASQELKNEGKAFAENVPLGIMIEVPSAAIMAKTFAKTVNFMSIGTNDLTQYLMAADRENTKVANLANYFNPAVLTLLQNIIEAGNLIKPTQNNEPTISMCGEMANDEIAAPLLFAFGLRSFSMQLRKIPKMKAFFEKLSLKEAKTILAKTKNATSAEAVKKIVINELAKIK